MTHYLTKEGLAEVQAELKQLKEVKLPDVLDSLNRARSEGDLRENAAYDSAKSDKEKIEYRIEELEDVLADYEIIKEKKSGVAKRVEIGGEVEVEYQNADNKKNFKLKIVGESEANAIEGKISNESPLALSILGKKKGDTASFKVKNQELVVKIIEIIS